MAILVTGAAGFIGSHVVAALVARGEAVLGIDNLNDYYDPRLKEERLEKLRARPGFEFLHLDFADKNALDGRSAAEATRSNILSTSVHKPACAIPSITPMRIFNRTTPDT